MSTPHGFFFHQCSGPRLLDRDAAQTDSAPTEAAQRDANPQKNGRASPEFSIDFVRTAAFRDH